MKKIFTVLCALLLVPTLALCDEIESIRSDVQSGSYDMEKINHAPIYIPDVSEINVIRAEKYEANPEIVQKYENAGMIAIEKMKMATLLYMGDEYDKKYGVDKRTQFLEYHIDSAWRLDDEELADIHAKNQPISAGEVVNKVKNMIRELYDESISIELKRIEVVSSFQKGKMVSDKMTSLGDYEFGDLTGIGGYGIEAYPTLDGVPIIASAGSGYLERGAEKIYDVLYFAHPSADVFYYSDDYMNISMMNAYKTKEVVFENVPLCGFDKVYEIVEKDGNYEMSMELPGVKKEDIQMELKDGYLKVTATHDSNTEDKDEKGRVVRKERVSGSYSRSFYVGEGIHQEDVKASFDNGELKIVVPKEAPKQIEENKFIPIE